MNQDFKEFFKSLNARGVEFLVVGVHRFANSSAIKNRPFPGRCSESANALLVVRERKRAGRTAPVRQALAVVRAALSE